MFALSLWGALVWAQSPVASPLNYVAARDKARLDYPAVAAAHWEAKSARVRTGPAGAWDDPMAGVQLWNMPLSHVEGALQPGLTSKDRAMTFAQGPDLYPVMFMLSQTFPWPGKKSARVDEARALANAADARVEVTTADVDRAVAYAWADISAARLMRANLKQTQRVLEALVELADGRLSSGIGRPADALGARSERENLQQSLYDVDEQEGIARSRLAALLGAPSPDSLSLVIGTLSKEELPTRDALLEAAWKQRPELKMARAQVDAAVARARAERLGMLPDVTGNVGYMAQFGGVGMAMMQGPYRALLGAPDMVTVGVTVPLPVFGPWKQLRSAEAADVDARRAQSSVDAVMSVARSEVDEALTGLTHARQHMALHESTLIPLSQKTLEAAQQAYATGAGDLQTLLGAARTLRAHHVERVSAELLYARHLADLQRATGMDLVHFSSEEEAP